MSFVVIQRLSATSDRNCLTTIVRFCYEKFSQGKDSLLVRVLEPSASINQSDRYEQSTWVKRVLFTLGQIQNGQVRFLVAGAFITFQRRRSGRFRVTKGGGRCERGCLLRSHSLHLLAIECRKDRFREIRERTSQEKLCRTCFDGGARFYDG